MKLNLFYEWELEELVAWLKERGQPGFRAQQIFAWAYQRAARSFAQMTDLPRALRQELAEQFLLGPLPIQAQKQSQDTVKLLLELTDGRRVECVRIQMGRSFTACLSSQVGCAIRCAFCATGQLRCERSLTVGEIVQQVVTIHSLGERVRNVVFMGMGEPFHNYENVVRAIRRLIMPEVLGMSPRRITISTAGVVPAIYRYAEEGLPTELAVSLNATTDEQRQRLMPGVARYRLQELLDACRYFSQKRRGQPVTFAYVLLEHVNDAFADAERLGKLLRGLPHHLNLIPFNPIPRASFHAPAPARVQAFLEACRRQGLNVSLRQSKGGDIEAACGQLRARSENEIGSSQYKASKKH